MTSGELPERISVGTPVIVRRQRDERSRRRVKWIDRQNDRRRAYWVGYTADPQYAVVSWDAPLGRSRERVPVESVRLLSAERVARKQKRTRLPDDRAESTSVRAVGGGLPEHNRRRH